MDSPRNSPRSSSSPSSSSSSSSTSSSNSNTQLGAMTIGREGSRQRKDVKRWEKGTRSKDSPPSSPGPSSPASYLNPTSPPRGTKSARSAREGGGGGGSIGEQIIKNQKDQMLCDMLPKEFDWARTNSYLVESLARWSVLEYKLGNVLPFPVRYVLELSLMEWSGEDVSRAWIEDRVKMCQNPAHQSLIRLVLMIAFSPHQVERGSVSEVYNIWEKEDLSAVGGSVEAFLVAVTSYASFVAVKKKASWFEFSLPKKERRRSGRRRGTPNSSPSATSSGSGSPLDRSRERDKERDRKERDRDRDRDRDREHKERERDRERRDEREPTSEREGRYRDSPSGEKSRDKETDRERDRDRNRKKRDKKYVRAL